MKTIRWELPIVVDIDVKHTSEGNYAEDDGSMSSTS